MKKIAQYIIILSIALIASCQHKELCYDHFHTANTNVIYKWSDTTKTLVYPKAFSMYIYPIDTGTYTRYEFTGHNGGFLKIPNGTYRVFTINSDTDNLKYRNRDTLEKFEVYSIEAETLDGSTVKSSSLPRAKGTESEKIVKCADSLWCDRYTETIKIFQDWKDTVSVDTIIFTPKLITKQIKIHINNVENLQYATGGVSASISGLSGGYFPYRDSLSTEKVTYFTELVKGKDDYTLNGVMNTFGDSHKEDVKHHLVIYAIMSDGSKWYTTHDITKNIHLQRDKEEIILELDGLSLPAPLFNGGGIKPDVNEWDNLEIPIKM